MVEETGWWRFLAEGHFDMKTDLVWSDNFSHDYSRFILYQKKSNNLRWNFFPLKNNDDHQEYPFTKTCSTTLSFSWPSIGNMFLLVSNLGRGKYRKWFNIQTLIISTTIKFSCNPILRTCIRTCVALKSRNPAPTRVMQCPTSWIAPMMSQRHCAQRRWRAGFASMWRNGGNRFFSRLAASLSRA